MVNRFRASVRRNPKLRRHRVRITDVHRDIGIRFRGSCSEKKVYPLRPGAELAARQHNHQFICRDMVAYWCVLHQCWHIGHKDKRRTAHEMLMEDHQWFIAWEAKSKRANQIGALSNDESLPVGSTFPKHGESEEDSHEQAA